MLADPSSYYHFYSPPLQWQTPSYYETNTPPQWDTSLNGNGNRNEMEGSAILQHLPIHITMEITEDVYHIPGQPIPDPPPGALDVRLPMHLAALGVSRLIESGWLDDVINDYLDDLVAAYFLNADPETTPAKEEDINNLPVVTVTNEIISDHDLTSCVICQENFKVGDKATKLPCKHLFCTECIRPWLETNRTCPLCREEIVSILPSGEKDPSSVKETEHQPEQTEDTEEQEEVHGVPRLNSSFAMESFRSSFSEPSMFDSFSSSLPYPDTTLSVTPIPSSSPIPSPSNSPLFLPAPIHTPPPPFYSLPNTATPNVNIPSNTYYSVTPHNCPISTCSPMYSPNYVTNYIPEVFANPIQMNIAAAPTYYRPLYTC